MAKSSFRRASREETRRLLADKGYKRLPELSDELRLLDVYELADGRALVVSKEGSRGGGTVWESKEALAAGIQAASNAKPTHVLTGRLPLGQEFVSKVPELIDELATILKIPRSRLDNSRDSLALVDRLVRKRYQPDQRIESRLFAPLVAYVGEVIRIVTAGEWKMRLAADGETWEPVIVTSRGEEYLPFLGVYEEFYNHSDKIGNIQGAISVD